MSACRTVSASPARISRAAAWVLAAAVAAGGLFALRDQRNPAVAAFFSSSGQREFPAVETGAPTMTVQVRFEAPAWGGPSYRFWYYGCLERLAINGADVRFPETSRCDGGSGVDAPVGALLQPGANSLDAVLGPLWQGNDYIGFFGFRPSPIHPSFLIAAVALLAAFLAAGLAAARVTFGRGGGFCLACVFLAGAASRLLLVAATPAGFRTPDVWGHMEYIRFVAEHGAIPAAQSGWEMYQPPLFYFLSAAWLRAAGWFVPAGMGDVQPLTFLLSAATLAIGIVILRRLLPATEDRRTLFFAALVFAAAPGLTLFAPGISNDVLAALLAFAFFAALLRWWSRPSTAHWLTACALVALGLLTKSNALVWVPLAAGAALIRPGSDARSKARDVACLGIVLLLACGWYYVLRFGMQGERGIVGNVGGLSPDFLVPNTPAYLAVFNPVRVLASPFIQNGVEGTGWGRFLEYLFASAHFGIFPHPKALEPVARYVLLGGMLAVGLGAYGAARGRLRGLHPLALLAAVLFFSSQLAYRVIHPFSFNQDARFSPLLPLLLAYMATHALRCVPERFRPLCEAALAAYAACCLAFTLLVAATT